MRPGEVLLKKNSVTLVTVKKKKIINDPIPWTPEKNKVAKDILRKSKITSSEVTAQILHRANKRVIFGKLPVYLWLYNFGTKRKHPELSDSSNFRRKLRNDFGEPPVIQDSNLVQLSATNIRNYLFNSGFFDAKVVTRVKVKRRKAHVYYKVYPGRAYLINSVFVKAVDSSLTPQVKAFADESDFFRLWWPINMKKLGDARIEISRKMRNLGYYTIIPESFRFELDTFKLLKQAQVTLILDNAQGGVRHVKYSFGGLIVNLSTAKSFLERTNNPILVRLPGLELHLNGYPVDPELLRRLIYIDSGNIYSQSDIEKTYQSLIQMGLFSAVDMRFFSDTVLHRIITQIDLRTIKRISFSIEPQGLYSPQGSAGTNLTTQSQRSFGLAGIVSFTNRNIAKNSENLRLSSVTSFEAIIKQSNRASIGNSVQQGFNASLTLPHFKLFKKTNWGSFSQRNTLLSISYQYENNPNFFRSAIPASLTLQYVKPKISWYYTPTEVSFNRNKLSTSFENNLQVNDPVALAFIRRVFTNQFVTAAKVGVIYANDRTKPGQTYVFGRLGFEASGNLHRLLRKAFDKSYTPGKVYEIFGLQYFQYSKIEGELRLRRTIDEMNSLAFRIRGGLAMPYGNSSVVPYDKRYFIGGSNSLRAWRSRLLGPGSTSDTLNQTLDRSGEFLGEINLEYRFSVIKRFLEMALFLDAGNIWNLKHKNQQAPSASILSKENFYDEVAFNTGIGFRFDFKFFLFRVDWGIPLHDPGKNLGKRWLLNPNTLSNPQNYIKKETALAFGIGYPF